MPVQYITLTLDGITAGDYMSRVRDPEPAALDGRLRSISVSGDPLGDTVEAALSWSSPLPEPGAAAVAAGLTLTPEVVSVTAEALAVAAA